MEKKINYLITLDSIEYKVDVTKKSRTRNIYIRYQNDTFFVSCNLFETINHINEVIKANYKKMLKKEKVYFLNDGLFIQGDFIKFSDGYFKYNEKFILFENPTNFYKKMKTYAYNYFLERIRFYEKIMCISYGYNLKLKNVRSIYGSNSKRTHTISLNLELIHYSEEISDSVIIHELVHDKIRNHSSLFYKEVLKYCPNYFDLDKKLRKGILK